jgi:hypothetical protein
MSGECEKQVCEATIAIYMNVFLQLMFLVVHVKVSATEAEMQKSLEESTSIVRNWRSCTEERHNMSPISCNFLSSFEPRVSSPSSCNFRTIQNEHG